jgi:hypothetical protein
VPLHEDGAGDGGGEADLVGGEVRNGVGATPLEVSGQSKTECGATRLIPSSGNL